MGKQDREQDPSSSEETGGSKFESDTEMLYADLTDLESQEVDMPDEETLANKVRVLKAEVLRFERTPQIKGKAAEQDTQKLSLAEKREKSLEEKIKKIKAKIAKIEEELKDLVGFKMWFKKNRQKESRLREDLLKAERSLDYENKRLQTTRTDIEKLSETASTSRDEQIKAETDLKKSSDYKKAREDLAEATERLMKVKDVKRRIHDIKAELGI